MSGRPLSTPATLARDKSRGPDPQVGQTLLRLRLFGHMRAEDGEGRSILPRTRKTRAVLAILALSSPRPVLRLQLTGLLWSQREKDQARASLRQAVHELQDTLSVSMTRLLVAERHHLALKSEGVWVDVLDATRVEGANADSLDCFLSPLLADLVGLDPGFDQWLQGEQKRLLGIARVIGDRVLADQAVGVFVSGFDSYVSYGYAAGTELREIASPF